MLSLRKGKYRGIQDKKIRSAVLSGPRRNDGGGPENPTDRFGGGNGPGDMSCAPLHRPNLSRPLAQGCKKLGKVGWDGLELDPGDLAGTQSGSNR